MPTSRVEDLCILLCPLPSPRVFGDYTAASFFHCPDPNAPRKEKDDRPDNGFTGSAGLGGPGKAGLQSHDRGWPWPNTEEGFLAMGRQLAQAMFEFYQLHQRPTANGGATGTASHGGRRGGSGSRGSARAAHRGAYY
eukprot:CAMPEP_0177788684 /NCGR_PEP_ID=MMETSP0491_2-20121128/22277_1 /TAXON_ID=63592 /ORGANISM="Tetraselmis chuii, Strain PLY429" /LENGTH=136 /DNA_ID=CAMNT_0019310357 /DNA_START=850 /DNA_END=1261 /DNA_ORIENTATION=-